MKLLNAFALSCFVMLILFIGCNNVASYSLAPPESEVSSLQFDGLYQSEVINDGGAPFWQYVRFYEDGTVISVSSIGTPAEIIIWFNKENIENGNFGHGHFIMMDSQLLFTATFTNGTVDYLGSFLDGALTLNSHSNINDTDATRTYTFVPLSEDWTL